jgi:hypothetical protein
MYDFVWKWQGGNEHHIFLDRTLIATSHYVLGRYYIQYSRPVRPVCSKGLATRPLAFEWLSIVHKRYSERIEK